jgi:hypothetical protein
VSCVGLLFFGSCSLLIQPDEDQCRVDADCSELGLRATCSAGLCVPHSACEGEPGCALQAEPGAGCGTDSDCADSPDQTCWKKACVPTEQIEPFKCTSAPPLRMSELPFTAQVKELSTQKPPQSLMVKVCRTEDTECSDPEKTFQDLPGSGDVTLLLPWEFSGYLEFSSKETLTLLYYMTRPVTEPVLAKSVLLITPGLISGAGMFSRPPVDLDDKGLIVALMHECSGEPAFGIRFEISDTDSRQFVLVDGLPSTDATLSMFDPAASQGTGGFLNVQPGPASVTARLGMHGPVLAHADVHVRPKTISQLEIYP